MTIQRSIWLGLTACAVWSMAALYGFLVSALSAYLTKPREHRTLELEGRASIALAFVASVVVSSLSSVHPLMLPIVMSIFAIIVTPSIGLGFVIILIERCLDWVARHRPHVGERPPTPPASAASTNHRQQGAATR